MTDNNELKETEIQNCVYYYFKNMVNINDLGSKNVQKYTQKKNKDIFIYHNDYETSNKAKPLHIYSNKIKK